MPEMRELYVGIFKDPIPEAEKRRQLFHVYVGDRAQFPHINAYEYLSSFQTNLGLEEILGKIRSHYFNGEAHFPEWEENSKNWKAIRVSTSFVELDELKKWWVTRFG